MSLVGYEVSSGESSDEEVEAGSQAQTSNFPGAGYNAISSSSGSGLNLSNMLPKPKGNTVASISEVEMDCPSGSDGLKLPGLLLKPEEKQPVSPLEQEASSESPPSSSSGLKLSRLLPKPRENSLTAALMNVTSRKGSLKITAPELPVIDSDSDEEQDPNAEKRKKFAGAHLAGKPRSGLFAKLPAPMNSAGITKGTGRTFLPYVFSKPKKEPAVKDSKVKLKADNNDNTEGESSSGGNLSIAEIRRRSAQAAAKIISEQVAAKGSTENEDSDDGDTSGGFFSYVEKIPESELSEDETMPNPSNDEPTTFKTTSNVIDFAPEVEDVYRQGEDAALPAYVPPPPPPEPVETSDDPMEAILRLQGKKRRKEEINFIDIRADDALEGNKELLLKSISEEKSMNRVSHSKRKHSGMPSGQQKRKHQLTYLAFQAKQRDLELRNQWAQNRATRQQTQSKYGF